MAKVFISYNRGSEDTVRSLAADIHVSSRTDPNLAQDCRQILQSPMPSKLTKRLLLRKTVTNRIGTAFACFSVNIAFIDAGEIKMKRLMLIAIASLGMTSMSANADLIEGEITFGGSAVGADWTTATQIDWINVLVTAGVGDFAPVPSGTNVTVVDPFVFDPAGSGAVDPFWTFNSGGLIYSFALEDWMINERQVDFLDLTGTGTVSITGYDDTPFNWALSLDEAGEMIAAVSMSNSPVPLPEPGTLGLLGLGLLGMGIARRRKKA